MVKQTVYVDVLIAVNLLVDYFLLYASAVISDRSKDRVRMCMGAVLGAAGSLTVLLPRMPPAAEVLCAIGVSAVMSIVSFGWGNIRSFVRTLTVLYALSAGYSGVMLLLWHISGSSNITVNNGAVYINIDPKIIVLTTVVLYAIMSFCSGRLRMKDLRRRRCRVTITEKGRSITLDGLVDTGNVLTEPFSEMPVLVSSRKALREILPEWITGAAKGDAEAVVRNHIRMVPYHTASGSGLMVAYRPERIDVDIDGRCSENVGAYIALTDNEKGMTEEIIVNPDVL